MSHRGASAGCCLQSPPTPTGNLCLLHLNKEVDFSSHGIFLSWWQMIKKKLTKLIHGEAEAVKGAFLPVQFKSFWEFFFPWVLESYFPIHLS